MKSTPPLFASLVATSLAFCALTFASNASAAPIVIQDQVDSAVTYQGHDYAAYGSANFANRLAGGKHWGDEIAGPDHRFDTTQVTVDRNTSANVITFTMRTMFNGNDLGAKYADVFIDTGSSDTLDSFGYAIALGSQTMGAGLYTANGVATANDIWGGQGSYIYGGFAQLKTDAPGFDAGLAIAAPVRLTSGSAVAGTSVSVTRTDVGGGFYDLSVAVQGLNLSMFNDFDLFWGTGDCGNDAVWASLTGALSSPVDAPPVLGLFGLALLGLMFFTYQRDKRLSLLTGY